MAVPATRRSRSGCSGREDEEGRPEQGVGAGREYREIEIQLLAAKDDLGALGATDPVALHRDHVLGPGIELIEVAQEALGVIGDPEKPLLELALDDNRPAALAATVYHLLIGEHRCVLGAPLDRSLGAVGEAALEELQKDPLGPAVVLRHMGAELARPIDRDPPLSKLAAEGGDRALGHLPRWLTRLDRVVLGRQAEGVISHRVDNLKTAAAAIVGDRITHRIGLEVANVGLTGGIGQHLQDVGLWS